MNLSSFKVRIRIVSVCICLFATILILKLFDVQIIHKSFYTERADKQYATPVGDIFSRGTIFFSKKDGSLVPAATVAAGFKVAIKAQDITNPEAEYTALKPYMTMDHTTFITKASNKSDPYEEVATHLSKEQADTISALNLPGVSIYQDNWRFYPGGSLASHTIGFLAYKGNDLTGQYGLERSYNSTLSEPTNQDYVNFFAEVFSNLKNSVTNSNETGDIVTTIEPTTQAMLESELKTTMDKWHGDQAGGIIMNPQNGEIYAMAASPDFDLNNFGSVSDTGVYRNPLIEDVFEFGSVVKPLVMSAALDQGVVTPQTTYDDKGSVVVDGKTIYNFDKQGRGPNTTMQTVLDQSLNTGMVFVQSKLSHDVFRSYMEAYGIGQKTGIDLPNETSGLISNLNSPRDLEYANAAFGQGIAVTPMELIRAEASLANGGTLVTPHLVKQIRYDDGLSKVPTYPTSKTAITNSSTFNTIQQMMVHVFESYNGGADKFAHYSVATKTGTAQVAMPNGKGYYPYEHMHSFIGFFPAYDPKFIVFLYIKNPKNVEYSSQTLIPPFMDITKFLLSYYNVPPDR
jgi:cell division protein FtsI/penicillin-binding protein 2